MNKKDLDINALKQKDAKREKKPVSDKFVAEHISLVESIASSIVGRSKLPSGVEFDDLVGWGIEGLLKAHDSFKEGKGSRFKTYAYYRIKGEIMDKIRFEWKARNPFEFSEYQKRMQTRLADFIEDAMDKEEQLEKTSEDVIQSLVSSSAMVYFLSLNNNVVEGGLLGTNEEELADQKETENIIEEEIDKLEEEERDFIKMFYRSGLKQNEIADRMNTSNSTISRFHNKVIDKLRRRLRNRFDADI